MQKFLRLIQFIALTILIQFTYAEAPLKPIQYVRGEPVFSSPYLGERSDFEAFDLIVNIPNVEQSLRLLEQMQDAEKRLSLKGYTMPEQPTVDLSGRVEVGGEFNNVGNSSNAKINPYSSSFSLDNAELDVFARVNKWTMAFFNIKYDKGSNPTPRTSANSRFYLDQGFLTVGNLNVLPVYVVAGQIYVPFGADETASLTGPLTSAFAENKQQAVLVGFKHGSDELNYNAAVYGFNSSYKTNGNDGGAKIGLNFSKSDFGFAASGGVISNILESGLYHEGGDTFSGFIASSEVKPTNRIIGWTAFASLSYKMFTLLGEYVTAAEDLPKAFFTDSEGKGIKPSAFHLETNASTKVFNIPSLFALGYGETRESLALEKPRRKVFMSVIVEPIKSTLFGIEYSREKAYKDGLTVKTWGKDDADNYALVDITGNGKWKNAINLFFGYYF